MTVLRILAGIAGVGLPLMWFLFVSFARGFACGYNGGSSNGCGVRLRDFFGSEETPITIGVFVVAAVLLVFAFRAVKRKDG